MSKKVGEFLVGLGLMTPAQVEEVLRAQQEGDSRRFGQIAVERGYIQDDAINGIWSTWKKQSNHQAEKDHADS